MTTLPAVAEGPPLIAGIDYSTKFLDVARVRGRKLVEVTNHPLGVDVAAQVGVISRLVIDLHDQGVAIIVMETPWMREGRGMGTAMDLHKIPTRVETLAAAAGIKVAFVPVNSWHKVVLGDGGLKTEAAKAASVRFAEVAYGWKAASHNAADSICLASWGAATIALETMRRGGRR